MGRGRHGPRGIKDHPAYLVGDRLSHFLVAVADLNGPHTANAVDKLVTVGVEDINSFGIGQQRMFAAAEFMPGMHCMSLVLGQQVIFVEMQITSHVHTYRSLRAKVPPPPPRSGSHRDARAHSGCSRTIVTFATRVSDRAGADRPRRWACAWGLGRIVTTHSTRRGFGDGNTVFLISEVASIEQPEAFLSQPRQAKLRALSTVGITSPRRSVSPDQAPASNLAPLRDARARQLFFC